MAMAMSNNIGGYDYSFVNKPHDRFICIMCHLPSRDPYLSVCCGHVFCKSCLDHIKKAPAITNACPVCSDEEFVTFPNKQAGREIRSLHVHCTNKEKGCEWQGELNDIVNHLGNNSCQLKCSNGCGKIIQQQYLTSHVEIECPRRKVNCQYCHDTGEHQFIEGQHKEECPKLPLPCPNKCEVGNVPREDLEAHRNECPLEMIQCEYYSVGCKRIKLARKDIAEHNNEKMTEHFMMTKNELTNTKVQLNETKSQLDETKSYLDVALKQINRGLARHGCGVISTHYSNTDIRSIQSGVMETMFEYVCPVTIQMTGYKYKKKTKTEWYSDPFYTHNKGYKMCLRIDAASSVRGYMSVFLYLMKGSHDDKLTWPMRENFDIKLLNQVSDYSHLSSRVSFYGASNKSADRVIDANKSRAEHGQGIHKLISKKNLHKNTPVCQYLQRDCLFFQVTKL